MTVPPMKKEVYDIISGDPRLYKRPATSMAGSARAAAQRLGDGTKRRPASAKAGRMAQASKEKVWSEAGSVAGGATSHPTTSSQQQPPPQVGKQRTYIAGAPRTTTLAQAISAIRATMDEQLLFSQKNSAIAQWHARPRTATLLRSSGPANEQHAVHPSEQRHQTSLTRFYSQCQSYRSDLKRWERDASRSTANTAAFPQFGAKRRPVKRDRNDLRLMGFNPAGLL